jgi:hypothetical protein
MKTTSSDYLYSECPSLMTYIILHSSQHNAKILRPGYMPMDIPIPDEIWRPAKAKGGKVEILKN